MFIRTVKVKDRKTNITREYLRIVKSYKEKGKSKQRVIAHLGRVDLIPKGQLTELAKKLSRFEGSSLYREDEIQAEESLVFGPCLIVRKIWEELNLSKTVKSICGEDIAERTYVLVLCRLLQPESEHGLSYFLKDYYVGNNKGKRWEPFFREDIIEALNSSDGKDRVKVVWSKLQRWYRALDKLIKNKEKIELNLYESIKSLFSLKVNVVFYDITSVYFEGRGPKDLAEYGYSRDNKKDNKQILLGIVLADGLPIAHHVFAGNTQDKTTLKFLVDDLKQRFNLNNIIFVADKGITTKDNINKLDSIGYKYILGVSLRNTEYANEILGKSHNLIWESYNHTTKYTFVETKEKDKTITWILVASEEKKEYEKKMRDVWMEKGAKELDKLRQRVKSGNLKDEKKIAYYLGSISKKYHIKRYFSFKIKEGKFRFWLDYDKLEKEERYEGKYLLRTTDEKLTPEDIIREYKNLWEIESCFRCIKDVLKIRPICHKTEERVKAHIFVAVLAYLVEKVIQRRIRQSGFMITTQDALKFTEEIKVVELKVGKKEIKLLTQKTSKITQDIFNLMGINLPASFSEFKVEKFTCKNYVQGELFY